MATIQIRTEIPGPKSRALMARREAAIPRGPSNATPVFAARAAKIGVALAGPRGMAASRRAMSARERGPGISVRI